MVHKTPDSTPFFSKIGPEKLLVVLDKLGIIRNEKLQPPFATECILEILSMHGMELFDGMDPAEIKILAIQKMLAKKGLLCGEILPATILVAKRLVVTRDVEMTN